MTADLRLGRWQDVLADVTCDALIVDAPYSERTHSGHDAVSAAASALGRREINYACWTEADVYAFVSSWSERVGGWFVSLTDDVLAQAWRAALHDAGRCAFAPLPLVQFGSRVRLSGDGPSSITTQIVVARPRKSTFAHWGTTPGAYVQPPGHAERPPVVGGKTTWAMRALVRDYTRPGDLVCDPCAGGGTTLLAALMEGRRAVGAECLPEHHEIARKRLEKGVTPPLFAEDRPAMEQADMFASSEEE